MANPVVQIIIKMIVSGIFVGLLSEMAKRLPGVGGLLAALPIVSLLTIFWLRVDGQTNSQISRFIYGILFGLIPTGLFLLLLKVMLDRGMRLLPAVGLGLIALAVIWIVVRQVFVA